MILLEKKKQLANIVVIELYKKREKVKMNINFIADIFRNLNERNIYNFFTKENQKKRKKNY